MIVQAKLQVIKEYRTQYGTSLKEALDAVNEIIEKADRDNSLYEKYLDLLHANMEQVVEEIFQVSPLKMDECRKIAMRLVNKKYIQL